MITRQIRLSCCLLLVVCSRAAGQQPPPPIFDEVERVQEAVAQVGKELVALMNDESIHPGYRDRAIRKIGALRPPGATGPLMDNLLFKAEWQSEPRPLASYPAAAALARYGRDAYETVWARSLNEWSDDYLYVLAFTLYTIDGKSAAITRVREKLVDPELTRTQKENLSKTLDLLEAIRFEDPFAWPRHGRPRGLK
jgi:hypothetical protein